MSFSNLSPEERQRKRESIPIRYMMRRPQAMYDIGVGPKTEWDVFRNAFPNMGTFGVEANPDMITSINSRGWNGPLLNAAITTRTENMVLKVYRQDGLDASILEIPDREVAKAFDVATMSLDKADEIFAFQDDILLWMDIEGAELDALLSGPNLIVSGRVRWINLEVRPNPPWSGGCTDKDVDQFLTSNSYKKVLEYNVHSESMHYDVLYFHISEDVNDNPTYKHIPNV